MRVSSFIWLTLLVVTIGLVSCYGESNNGQSGKRPVSPVETGFHSSSEEEKQNSLTQQPINCKYDVQVFDEAGYINDWDQVPKEQLNYVRKFVDKAINGICTDIINDLVQYKDSRFPSTNVLRRQGPALASTIISFFGGEDKLRDRVRTSKDFYLMLANFAEKVLKESKNKMEETYKKKDINMNEFKLKAFQLLNFANKVIKGTRYGHYIKWNELLMPTEDKLIEELGDMTNEEPDGETNDESYNKKYEGVFEENSGELNGKPNTEVKFFDEVVDVVAQLRASGYDRAVGFGNSFVTVFKKYAQGESQAARKFLQSLNWFSG